MCTRARAHECSFLLLWAGGLTIKIMSCLVSSCAACASLWEEPVCVDILCGIVSLPVNVTQGNNPMETIIVICNVGKTFIFL